MERLHQDLLVMNTSSITKELVLLLVSVTLGIVFTNWMFLFVLIALVKLGFQLLERKVIVRHEYIVKPKRLVSVWRGRGLFDDGHELLIPDNIIQAFQSGLKVNLVFVTSKKDLIIAVLINDYLI